MKKKTFSQIELLIVIAVIVVLAALLMPALGRAGESALQIQCASNLKQLGVGFAQYQADNQDYYPQSADPPAFAPVRLCGRKGTHIRLEHHPSDDYSWNSAGAARGFPFPARKLRNKFPVRGWTFRILFAALF